MDSVISILTSIVSIFVTIVVVLGITTVIAVVANMVLRKVLFQQKIKNHKENPNRVVLLIKNPPSNQEKEKAMEEFLRSLHRVLPNQTHVSLEMVSSNQFLRFYIAIPRVFKNVIESQMYAQYPEAEIEEVPDYLKDLDENAAIVELKFKRPSLYPVKTYHNLEENLLKTMSAMLSKTDPEDKVYIQMALKRVGSKFWQRGFRAGQHKLTGRKYIDESNPTPAHYKLSQDVFMGKLRIAYVSKDKFTAQNKLLTLVGLFKTLKGSYNEFKKRRHIVPTNLRNVFQARVFEKGDLWIPAELATIYHFPYGSNLVSNVVNTHSKHAPAPDILPREGLVDPREVSFFGETNYRNEKFKFGIKRADRRRHLYIVGKTGSGKSRLLELLIGSDIANGEGCCIIDPHGDLADELLLFVPKERIKDVVYVNPSDVDFPIGFNPLEPVEDFQMRQHLSTFFIAIFKKLFAANWNARMEHLIRYITLALLETPDSNIMGIPRILSDTTYRQKVIMQIQDPVVKSFWVNEFSSWNEQFANDAVIPIMNKTGQFIANPMVRNIIGQSKNMLDFEHFMNNGNIVLMNLSKGRIGDENAALLGSMFITKIQQAALQRARMPEEARRDFYFYVDEFQNFATDAFSSILSEARKYRLDLTIAHQYMAQLPTEVKATAFGNVGSIVMFSVGGDDAAYLSNEFAPTFSQEDMINLNTREMYIKMSIDGRITPPFSARTLDVPAPAQDYSVEILEHSRMTYGKDRATVENEIQQWTLNAGVGVQQHVGVATPSFPEPMTDTAHATSDDEFPEPIL